MYNADLIKSNSPATAAGKNKDRLMGGEQEQQDKIETTSRDMSASKDKTVTFFKDLDVHGIGAVSSAQSTCERATWVTIMTLCTSVLIAYLTLTTYEYMSNPVLTTSSLKLDQASLPFPHLQVCPLQGGGLNWTFLGLNPDITKLIASHESSKVTAKIQDMLTYLNLFATTNGNTTNPPTNYTNYTRSELYLLSCIDVAQFVEQCSFEGEPCPPNSLHSYYDRKYGCCFHVYVPNAVQRFSDLGLEVRLNLRLASDNMHTGPSGVRIQLQSHLNPLATYRSYAAPGTWIAVTMHLREYLVQNVTTPLRKLTCSPTGRPLHVFNLPYRRKDCHLDCLQQHIRQVCGCVFDFDHRFIHPHVLRNTPVCHSPDTCVNGVLDKTVPKHINNGTIVTQGSLDPSYRRCFNSCNIECQRFEYLPQSSAARLHYKNANDYTVLEVAFESLDYEVIQEIQAMSYTTLLSNIGGQLGLWMGASLFTVIQFCAGLSMCTYRTTKKECCC